MSCPAPFLKLSDYPPTGGYIGGRLCGTLTADLQCCLPCKTQNWIYSNHFNSTLQAAYWLNVPSLVCQVFMLLTFLILPKQLSHRHYLSISLCISLILLESGFIVPLGTRPDMCYNDITPKDQYSSLSCAWSGALFIAGSCAASIWILLRSIWIHLQLCWGFVQIDRLFWPIQIIGWIVPSILIAISMPVTGVSYRLGSTCLPNQHLAFVTYLGWLMAFGAISAILQLVTTGYCLWIFLRDAIHGGKSSHNSNTGYTGGSGSAGRRVSQTPTAATLQKVSWRRMKSVLKSQWRSILLCIFNILNGVYYGSVFARQIAKNKAIQAGTDSGNILQWATCIVLNGQDPNKCQHIANVIDEPAFLTSFVLAGLIGMITFLLMLRGDMIKGWWGVIRHGRTGFARNNADEEDGVIIRRKPTELALETTNKPYLSLSSPTSTIPTSKDTTYSPVSPVSPAVPPIPQGVLPDSADSRQPSVRSPSVPVAGDATKRHDTTTLFDEVSDEKELQPRRKNKIDQITGGTDSSTGNVVKSADGDAHGSDGRIVNGEWHDSNYMAKFM